MNRQKDNDEKGMSDAWAFGVEGEFGLVVDDADVEVDVDVVLARRHYMC